jgi:hypothetical protein
LITMPPKALCRAERLRDSKAELCQMLFARIERSFGPPRNLPEF